MKSPQRILRCLTALAAGALLQILSAINLNAAVITNDVFWKDTSGNNIYSQGGGVFKFGSTYYWYGVRYAGAAQYAADPHGKKEDTTFVAVTCYSSTDLVNWKFENNIVTASTPGLNNPTWFGRLGVFYNAATSRYICVAQYYGGLGQGNIYFTGTSPTGNFSVNSLQYPVPGVVNNTTGDQTVFTDTDGQSYLICSSSSGRSNWYVAPFNSNGIGTQTAVRIGGGTGREGNCMFKYNGRYYFCSSDLYGWNASRCYYISATNIMGPYGSEAVMTNSALDYCHVTQTGFFVTVVGTSGTAVLFCGDRWADFAGNGNGYNQWCPVTFNGTTPIFNSLSKWDFNAAAGTWTVAPGNNYSLNPTYEADRVVQSTAVGWTTTSNSGNSGGNGNGRTGDFYFRHTGTATTRQTLTVPNGVYTLKVWHRTPGGQSTCRMFARNYGGSQLNTNLNTAASSWTERTVSNINVTNGSIEIGIESVGGSVDFDDWELTSGGTVTAPAAPSNLGAVASGTTINLTWTDNASNESSFKIERAAGGGSFSQIATPGTNATSYSDTGLVASTAYQYRIRANNSAGDSSYSNTASATTGTGGGADTYQAESGTLAGGTVVATNQTGYNGTGFVDFPSTGGTLTFNNVDGNGGGTKTIAIRFANGHTSGATRTGTISINGGTATNITFAHTGTWTNWTTMNVTVTLNNNATNTIRLASTGQDLGNIDEITVP